MTFNAFQGPREEDSLTVTGAERRQLDPLPLSPRVVTVSWLEALNLQSFCFNVKEM
jgi:hypothetical protein